MGDSVAFGFGVNNNETIASILSRYDQVCDISIPVTGPAEYIKMIDNFLKRSYTSNITVLFFLRNDYRNLSNSSWKELESCMAPINYRINSSEISDTPESPLKFVFNRVLRNSQLLDFLYGLSRKITAEQRDVDILKNFRLISKSVIKDLSYQKKKNSLRKINSKTIELLEKLQNAICVDDNIKDKISTIIVNLKINMIDDIYSEIHSISLQLISKNCYPFSSKKLNLTSFCHG